MTRFDALESTLANARSLSELSLGQARLDSVLRDPLPKNPGDSSVGQFWRDVHKSSCMTIYRQWIT